MAYSRYSSDCNWYIFWEHSEASTKEEELLAVWHVDHRKEGPTFTFTQIKEMLSQRKYSNIPGYENASQGLLEAAFQQFVSDVTSEYKSQG
jgi:hypothetical protein